MNLAANQRIEDNKLYEDIPALSISLGLTKALYKDNERVISHMPVAIYPYLIQYEVYSKLKQMHLIWQSLFVKIAADKEFLKELAQKFCRNDPYMEKLFHIYLKRTAPTTGIACTRVDYMGDAQPKLVQYNLMSVGLNAMSDQVQQLHKILNHYNSPIGKFTYPDCYNQQTLCRTLIKALQIQNLQKGIILMIVHDKQFNYGDQAAFKLELLRNGRQAISVTMEYLIQHMKFDSINQDVYLHQKNIDAFYFRTGYRLQHFPTPKHWQIRQQIEKSRAIKFPSIDMILINSKRVQSELSKQSILMRYLTAQQTQKILSISGQIYDFDNKTQEQVSKIIQMTKDSDYVLKPNREGGGNNFFGKKAYSKLMELSQSKQHLQNYILMKKINSKVYENYFVSEHKAEYVEKTTAQFSTFGCFIYNNNELILNQTGGTLVRVKKEQYEEGGIAVNKGALSGVCVLNYT